MRRLLAALGAVLVLTGCANSDGGSSMPGASKVDVDTPALRAAKQAAGIDTCAPGGADPVEGGLPAVTLPCLGGGPDVDLASLRGPLVVSLWASWCTVCKDEMPVLQAFQEHHGDKVPVLGVDYLDVQPAAALALARSSSVTYPSVADPQGVLNGQAPFPALRGLPFVALVDADGTVRYRGFGGIKSEQDLVDLVHEHLGIDL